MPFQLILLYRFCCILLAKKCRPTKLATKFHIYLISYIFIHTYLCKNCVPDCKIPPTPTLNLRTMY